MVVILWTRECQANRELHTVTADVSVLQFICLRSKLEQEILKLKINILIAWKSVHRKCFYLLAVNSVHSIFCHIHVSRVAFISLQVSFVEDHVVKFAKIAKLQYEDM